MKFRRGNSVLSAALFVSIFCVGAPFVFAADLVNINSADLATLETLNGIGPSKGQAIIDYRTQHGTFATIADIQNVSGIGAATYANIKDYITVGDSQGGGTTSSDSANQSTTTAATQTQITEGAPLPPPITARIAGDTHTSAGAGTVYQGSAYDTQGEPLTTNVRYMWNFGDGALAEGGRVMHTYRYPGTYLLTLSVAYSYMTASVREVVAVVAPAVELIAQGDGSLTIFNHAAGDLDVGLWSLVDGTSAPFGIPEGTVVLAGQGLRFAADVTHLPGSPNARLLYPNTTQAASAKVAADSPLRGEKVSAATDQAIASNVVAGGGLTSDGEEASGDSAAAESPYPEAASVAKNTQTTPWIFAGLAVILCIGAAGAWFAARQPAAAVAALAVTPTPQEEFELE